MLIIPLVIKKPGYASDRTFSYLNLSLEVEQSDHNPLGSRLFQINLNNFVLFLLSFRQCQIQDAVFIICRNVSILNPSR